MTGPAGAALKDDGDFEQRAVGFGQRRVVLVAGLLGGLCIAGAGIGWAAGSAAVGRSMESGIMMAGAGLVLTGLGWLATAWLRFTRKPPKPLPRGERAAAGTRSSINGGWAVLGVILAGCAAIVLFAPRGREPEVLALLPMVAAIPAVVLLGLFRIQSIMRRRDELYGRWLARRHG